LYDELYEIQYRFEEEYYEENTHNESEI
jgi:hypothetical protein